MIYGPDDVENLKNRVIPPNWEPEPGVLYFDNRISFMSALELAVFFRDERGSPLLLQELGKLYPEDVSASIGDAEKHVKAAGNFAMA
ncbi:MAG: hypothetical protein FWB85_03530 [Chitinispirillia bacterium]|nr:hypothetical protein [Chitinispirillia bacterium]